MVRPVYCPCCGAMPACGLGECPKLPPMPPRRSVPARGLTDAECEAIARKVWASVGVPDESVLSQSERYFISNCAMAFIRAGHAAATPPAGA